MDQPTRIFITPEEKSEQAKKQAEALPANATARQIGTANLCFIRKGEQNALGVKHPKGIYIKKLLEQMLDAQKIDIKLSYVDKKPLHIKFDSTDSFRTTMVASLIKRACERSEERCRE